MPRARKKPVEMQFSAAMRDASQERWVVALGEAIEASKTKPPTGPVIVALSFDEGAAGVARAAHDRRMKVALRVRRAIARAAPEIDVHWLAVDVGRPADDGVGIRVVLCTELVPPAVVPEPEPESDPEASAEEPEAENEEPAGDDAEGDDQQDAAETDADAGDESEADPPDET